MTADRTEEKLDEWIDWAEGEFTPERIIEIKASRDEMEAATRHLNLIIECASISLERGACPGLEGKQEMMIATAEEALRILRK